MSNITSFGEWLQRRRKMLDITQQELADQVGCARATIKSIEADARRPSKQLAERLAGVLELPPNDHLAFVKAARAELMADKLPLAVLPPLVPVQQLGAAAPQPPSAALLTGTLTFLFTDIADSTRLWEQFPQTMPTALARHDTVLRHAIETHQGTVVKHTGDGLLAVFAHASDGLAAAVAGQHGLQIEQWSKVDPLRVRMALHTGSAELRDGDYYGAPLNRLARLLAAGHAGQILLSHLTHELVCDELPRDILLRDLGEYQLKDLTRPEQIFQLVAPDLPTNFPPLRTLDTRPNNLPIQPTALIGRDEEMSRLRQQLGRAEVRLVTLTGPGGVGKTRLALQIAAELVDEFSKGVYFVALAPLRDSALVAFTLAQTLGLYEVGNQSLVEQLKHYLRDRQMLLVFDNFEHLLEAAVLVAELLAVAPDVKVLVTSRTVLHLRGEQEFVVPPLRLPDPTQPLAVERVSEYAAVELFVQRARDVKPNLELTPENVMAIAALCIHLDGLPLAIELAAAGVKLFAPPVLRTRLEKRLPLLTSGARDLPARQQTLRNTIAWSYQLLSDDEQTLFRRLAVFVGGGTLEAAETVCNADGKLRTIVLEGLAALVDKSLLRQEEGAGGESRFVMLETIREYALERLMESSELDTLHLQHAMYYLTLAEVTAPKLAGAEQQQGLNALEAEHDNLRSARKSFQDQAQELELEGRLAMALSWFWYFRGYWSEWRVWGEGLLARTGVGENTPVRATALFVRGAAAWVQSDYNSTETHLEECIAILRTLRERHILGYALVILGQVQGYQGELKLSLAHFHEGIAILREAQDLWWIAVGLNSLGDVLLYQGDYEHARVLFEESLVLGQRLGNKAGIAFSLKDLAKIARYQRDYPSARSLSEQSLMLGRELGVKRFIALTLHNLAWVALHQDENQEARERFQEGLSINRDIGDQLGILTCLEGLASLAAVQERPVQAAWLFGFAESLRITIQAPMAPSEQVDRETGIAMARAQLDEAAFAATWIEGRAMSLEQTVAVALTDDHDNSLERAISEGGSQ